MSGRSTVVALVGVLSVASFVPTAGAAPPFEADLTLFGDVGLDGDVVWNSNEPVIDLRDGSTVAPVLEIEAASATVHTYTWTSVKQSTPLMPATAEPDYAHDQEAVQGFRLLGVDSSERSRFTIVGAAPAAITTDGFRLRAADEFQVSADPTFEGRSNLSNLGFTHAADDVVVVETDHGMSGQLAGDLTLTFWEMGLDVQTDNGTRTFESGRNVDQALLTTDQVRTKRVHSMELVDATVSYVWNGPAGLGDPAPSIDLAGTLLGQASGNLTSGSMLIKALRDSLLLRGHVTLTPTLSAEAEVQEAASDQQLVQHYDRVDMHLAGTISALFLDGDAEALADPGISLPVQAAFGASFLMAGFALYKYGPIFGAGLLSRVTKKDTLRSPSRSEVWEVVRNNPGLFAREIGDHCSISRSTTRYHLQVLSARGYISPYNDGKTVRYYENHGKWAGYEDLVALLQHPKTKTIAQAIVADPGANQGALVDATGLSQSTVSFHLLKLKDAGAIRKERHGGQALHTYHPTTKLSGVFSRLDRNTTAATQPAIAMEVPA